MSEAAAEPTLLLDIQDRVALITLDRPKVLNALNAQLLSDLDSLLARLDADPEVGCVVLTGSAKAFAAGADIKEMAGQGYPQIYLDDYFRVADRLAERRKPLIAAVAGYALGGGCELALLCDFIYACADTARFGLPEITLGVIPGIGGTQRLTRALGKAKAMELCLTGRQLDAAEAERAGLVAQVFPAAELLERTLETARGIASRSLPATLLLKESVNRAFETSLAEGIRFERRVFHSLFASADQKEGMAAFVEKRPVKFEHR
ncbi:enoyl-CoA hydratase [Pseudomonas psychrotolerans]|nr:enoyl-CoA hydratase [Pseudomonas psychrotolerans]